MQKLVLFDLDGTLTDSAPGITRSVSHALEKMGYPAFSQAELETFVGPPLMDHLQEFTGMSLEDAQKALGFFRERFSTIGKFENSVYEGIPELLESLKSTDALIGMATSKPELFAEQIAEHFGFRQYFDYLCGAAMDETRSTKEEVLDYVLETAGYGDKRDKVIMVGDRKYDVTGAREKGLKSIGVTYGYGSRQELEEAGADRIAGSVEELKQILLEELHTGRA